ncbi:MAG: alcohol dehydrogenase catalytic domain-containing protein [Anaerolineae bacterium]|nr:alcohol dehydrogenase catalytic domain-containing protein [Anaerolineae bacterium]
MVGLSCLGAGRVELVELPEPVPGPGEVVIETAVSGICGSELHAYRGQGLPQGNGGHEAVGTVAALGQGVTGLATGTRVGVSAIAGCGRCAYCARGQYTYCPDRRFYGNMHAQRFLAAANACYPLPDDVPWEAGVLLTGDGLGVPFHTALKLAAPEVRTVAVFGVGPIGLGNVLVQAALGRRVIAIDLLANRLEKARQLGAGDVVDASTEDVVARVRALTAGAGPDVCIEAAGRPETALACFEAVRTAGTVVFNGEQGALPLSPSAQFIRRDLTAVGSWFYHFSEIDAMLAWYRRGLPVTDLISHRYPLAEAAAAYERFAAGQSAKVVLVYQ